MRKVLAILIVLCIIAAGLWYFLKPPAVRVSADAFFPPGTLATIEIHRLEQVLDEFKNSRLGKNLGKIDIAGLLEQLGAEKEKVNQFSEGKDRFSSVLNNKGLMELFGEEVHLALLPIEGVIEKPENILEKIVIIAYPRRNPNLLEIVESFFTADLPTDEIIYNDQKIKSVKVEESLFMHYCFTEGVLLSSFGMDSIKGAIDRRKKGAENLLSNNEYKDLRLQIFGPHSRTFAYIDIPSLKEKFKEIVLKEVPQGEEGTKQRAHFEKQLLLYDGFKSLAYSSYEKRGHEPSEKVLISLDEQRLTESQKATYLAKPKKNNTLSMVPANTIYYNWASNFKLRHTLNDYLFLESMSEKEREGLNKKVEEATGATLDEIDKAIGGEIALFMTDIKTGGLFPVPVFAFMAQAKGTELIENIINSFVVRSGMTLEKEVYESTEIKHLMLPFGSDIQPAYTFYEGFLIVAINPALIKEMMNARKSGKDIRSEENFKSIDNGLSGKNNSISFVRLDEVAEKMSYLAQWGKNMLMMKGPEAAEKATLLVNHLVDPVLDGLKMYKAVGARSFANGQKVEIDYYCNVDSKIQ